MSNYHNNLNMIQNVFPYVLTKNVVAAVVGVRRDTIEQIPDGNCGEGTDKNNKNKTSIFVARVNIRTRGTQISLKQTTLAKCKGKHNCDLRNSTRAPRSRLVAAHRNLGRKRA